MAEAEGYISFLMISGKGYMAMDIQSIKDYIKKYRYTIILMFLVTGICYAKHAFTLNAGIDTEDLLLGGTSNLEGWLTIGRFGAYYTKIILDVFHYNPYFSGLLFMVFFAISAVLWMYNFYEFGNHADRYPYWLFGILYVTSPLWCMIFYFSMLQLELSAGLCCAAVCVYLQFDLFFHKQNKRSFIIKAVIAAVLFVWAVGSYQAVLPVYFAGVCGTFIILYREGLNEDSIQLKEIWSGAIGIILHFVVSYIIYTFITRVFFSGSSYLEDQITWGNQPAGEIIRELLGTLWHTYIGYDEVHNKLILAAGIFFALDIIWIFVKHRKIADNITYLLISGMLVLTPFALFFYMGGMTEPRTHFPQAVLSAFLAMYAAGNIESIGKEIKREQYMKTAVTAVLLLFVYQQTAVTLRLWYTDDVCNRQTQLVAYNISADIDSLGFGDKPEVPIVILGKKDTKLLPVCLKYNMFGMSNFAWDYNSPAGGSVRSGMYLNAVTNSEYYVGNEEQREAAVQYGAGMPCYPSPGYVEYAKDIDAIIVKLSEY